MSDVAPRLLGARRVLELLTAHGIRPQKALGQNFVIDPNTVRKVVRAAALRPEDRVLEIGAGIGSLTLGLATAAEKVAAVEVDEQLVPILRAVLEATENVTVLVGDALELDLRTIDVTRLVANLPYRVAAQIVLRALEEAPQIEELTVMTQREVAERLAAPPGSGSYGLTSVLVAYWGRAEVAASVSRRAFYPVPNVDSAVVKIVRRPVPEGDRAFLFDVVRGAFSQRRKTLRNALATLVGSADAAAAAVEKTGLSPSARGEELSLDDFVALAGELAYTLAPPPSLRRST